MNDLLADTPTFEQSLTELEQIIHDLEDGQTGLEDALDRYEKGIGLLKRCYEQLRKAEQRILLLSGEDAEGQPVLQPFEHSSTAELSQKNRVRRVKE